MLVNLLNNMTLKFVFSKNALTAVLFMQNYSTSHKIHFVNLLNII